MLSPSASHAGSCATALLAPCVFLPGRVHVGHPHDSVLPVAVQPRGSSSAAHEMLSSHAATAAVRVSSLSRSPSARTGLVSSSMSHTGATVIGASVYTYGPSARTDGGSSAPLPTPAMTANPPRPCASLASELSGSL
ncbi:Uncharacterised protein [Mycobacteroides abscessus subsp. abscessus]|nr:Uncharacterised protein [Mycobacteroides abscessus subsp. abscessus]